MPKKNPAVDAFISKEKHWQPEFRNMRAIALACGLTEEMQWRLPCYTFQGGNVAIIQGFKQYCALMFFKGSLLKDARRILIAPGASQAARQARFTNVQEIAAMDSTLKAYIREAIDLERAGSKVTLKKTSAFTIPQELQSQLDKGGALERAFEALTPGRQRAYLFYFSEPKKAETRKRRVERALQRILAGKGLND